MLKILNSKFYILTSILIIAAFLRLYNITEMPPGLYPDEAIYANNGVEAWETGDFKVFYPENNGREGLWPNVVGFFVVNFGHEPWVPRSTAAVFGILTVWGVYFLTKELFKEKNSKPETLNFKQTENSNSQNLKNFEIPELGFRISHGEKIALLSSFLIAVSFWHILFSRIGFRAIMAPMFLVWGIYFLLTSLNRTKNLTSIQEEIKNQISKIKNANQKLKIIILAVVGGIFYGLGFHTYIAYRATPFLVLIILLSYWMRNKEKEVCKKILLAAFYFLLSTIVVAAPLGLYFLENPQDFFGRTTQISIFNSPTAAKDLVINILATAGMFNFAGDFNWRHNYSGKPLLFWPVGILFIIGIFLAVKSLIQELKFKNQNDPEQIASQFINGASNSKFKIDEIPLQTDAKTSPFAFYFLISWLVITALPVIISNEGLPHALRAILMAPAAFILAGLGGIWLTEKIKNTNQKLKIFRFLPAIFCLLLIIEAYATYFILWAKNPNVPGAFSEDYAKIGRELKELPDQLPKYVVVEASGVPVFYKSPFTDDSGPTRGIPMPAQTVMFITDTFTAEKQKNKNLYYILPEELKNVDQNRAYVVYLK